MNSKAYIPLLLMGTTLLMTTACSENLMADLGFTSRGDKISFTVNTEETLEETTRGATQAKAVAFEGTQPSRPLFLSAEVTQRPAVTRGTRIEDAGHLQSFGVSAIKANENVSAEQFATATPDFFYNLKAERNTSDVFEIAEDFYWPSTTDKLFFYAYTPYDDKTASNKVQISDADAGGAQKVTFTVDTNVGNQVDLMTAYAETTSFHSASGSTNKSSVGLDFKHELTAIRFVIGEQWLAGNIKSVGIYNVHGVGTMTIGADDASKWVWKNKAGTDVAATDDFVLTVDKIGVTGTEGEQFIDNTSLYFLMIPQSFDDNDDAYIEVKYQDNSYEYTVTAPLKGQAAWVRNTTVTYAISSHELTKLKIGSIQWPSNTDWKGPKTAFVSGDEVGLYVVDEDGTYLPHKNVRCTYNGSSWTVHHPDNNPVYMLPGQQYFFYYPYTPTPDTTYPVAGQGTTNTAATDFFSHLISGWTPAALQNDAQGTVFKAQDLQVGKATVSTSVASTINATMAHQMNLAIITLGQKTINEMGYYDTKKHLSNDANYEWVHTSVYGVVNSNYDITASSTFGGSNRPWKNTSNNKYYFVFKPVVDLVSESGTDIEGLQSDNVSADWTENFKTTDIGKGFERTAQSTRTEYVSGRHVVTSNTSYTLAIGDLFYADGAIAKSKSTYDGQKTFVGLVFRTSTTAKDKAINAKFKHGYVMGSTMLEGNFGGSGKIATDATTGGKKLEALRDYVVSDLDGLRHSQGADGTAKAACSNLNTAHGINMNLTSGYFIPSWGQYYLWHKNFTGLMTTDDWPVTANGTEELIYADFSSWGISTNPSRDGGPALGIYKALVKYYNDKGLTVPYKPAVEWDPPKVKEYFLSSTEFDTDGMYWFINEIYGSYSDPSVRCGTICCYTIYKSSVECFIPCLVF